MDVAEAPKAAWEWFTKLPTWGKVAVGGGAGLGALLIWHPWSKTASTGGLLTESINPNAGPTGQVSPYTPPVSIAYGNPPLSGTDSGSTLDQPGTGTVPSSPSGGGGTGSGSGGGGGGGGGSGGPGPGPGPGGGGVYEVNQQFTQATALTTSSPADNAGTSTGSSDTPGQVSQGYQTPVAQATSAFGSSALGQAVVDKQVTVQQARAIQYLQVKTGIKPQRQTSTATQMQYAKAQGVRQAYVARQTAAQKSYVSQPAYHPAATHTAYVYHPPVQIRQVR